MGGQSPNPPVNPPTPLPQQPAPEPAPGTNNETDDGWFLKFTNMRELANGDHFERVNGLRITLAFLLKTDLVIGWYHTSVFGGSLTRVVGYDTKLNLGGYVGFIGVKKTEITRGEKISRVYAGVKFGHVTGRKNSFQGKNEIQNSAIEKVELLNKSADYWTVKKELETTLNEHAEKLKREHDCLDETITSLQQEFNRVDLTADTGKVDGDKLAMKSNIIAAECEHVKQKASSNFEILADASAELLASGKWQGYCRGDVKLMASGLQKFAASISKLG